ncbi:hypothetical protein NC653_000654 [Populus alba x Populus x berolinensis]|uniref:Uncharacterized protein n=1 Tax=Populus alba x Populus x berolinensis TaxID=444605 RepID=A0AAD6RJ52_9ROSI|nr:hypothetical protein NC653_000654 [Populus alba x Populus x berolinensis]
MRTIVERIYDEEGDIEERVSFSFIVPGREFAVAESKEIAFSFLENDNCFSEVSGNGQKREEMLLIVGVSRESAICYLESGRIER